MKTWWFPPILVAMAGVFIIWKMWTGLHGLSCTVTDLPSDIFILKAMTPFNRIWLEVQYSSFICLLPFSICLYSLFPVVQFLLALSRSKTWFPVHTLFSSNQEKLIAERRIPVLQSQLEEYKSILCQLQAQKYKLQTEVLESLAINTTMLLMNCFFMVTW